MTKLAEVVAIFGCLGTDICAWRGCWEDVSEEGNGCFQEEEVGELERW